MESDNVQDKPSMSTENVIEARMNEIDAMANLIDTPSNNILNKKLFPKHMKRRAMSHDPMRIPERLREDHINMREKSGISDTAIKTPRRKHRRRPENLLSDYNRRQQEFVWLETHLWHAKRFRMKRRWGYSIPHTPRNKCHRSLFRASGKFCLIQDISYFCCIELSGKVDDLLKGLNVHTSTECGLTFNSQHTQSGNYEGSVFLYESNKYPYGAIGEVTYFWKPPNSVEETRTLWIWCHPSIYYKVVHELTITYSLKLILNDETTDKEPIMDGFKNIEMEKLKLKNVPFSRTNKLSSEVSSVNMVLLKDTLNRFRLIGPKSQYVISQAFKPIDFKTRITPDWARRYFNDGHENIYNIQYAFWEKIKNVSHPGNVPSHLIMSAIVIDPRFTLPRCPIRHKVEDDNPNLNSQPILYEEIPRELPISPIWSSDIRDEVTMAKISTQQLNDIRAEKAVPGLDVELKNCDSHPVIPILLIQTPGANNYLKPSGYGAGWDIIAPCGYGLPIWHGLHFQNGRPGGIKEFSNVCREAGKLIFPPDTSAGVLENEEERKDDTDRHFRLPPAKRPNYIKLGFPNPFHCPWKILMKEWSGSETFFVVRNLKKLNIIRDMITGMRRGVTFDPIDKEALVPIIVILRGRGTLTENTHICIPTLQDLIEVERNYSYSPVEPQHDDIVATQRCNINMDHKALLKKLKRKRRKNKKRGIDSDLHSSTAMVTDHSEIMMDHWLPECTAIKNYCSRSIIGFLTEGDFSLAAGKSCGVGYVSLEGLLSLISVFDHPTIRKQCCYVLVRSRSSPQYWFASLHVAF